MLQKDNNSIFDLSYSDTARFRRIVIEVLSEACRMPSDEDSDFDGIGRLGEKQMHAAIKRFICPDESRHEVVIDGSALCIERNGEGEDKKPKKRRFVADVMDGNTIYEIQSGPFSPLREKINWILDNTRYNVVVIHPIAETKWINYINAKSGEVERRQKSPQKGSFSDVAGELYFMREFLQNPRFSLILLMIEAEQYKKNEVKDTRRRPRYRKYELIPVSLLRAYLFKSAEDYRIFIPDSLPDPFTVREYSAGSKIRGMDAYSIVKTLVQLGLLEEAGKKGRAAAYRVANNE